jgi:hypothetical protein
MLSILLSLFFVLTSSTLTQAFTYSSYMDIQSLPENNGSPNSISYNQEDVEDVGNMLKVPPLSEVVFGVDGEFNNDNVGFRIFLSKDNIYQGDLTKILDIELPYDEFPFVKDFSTAWRYGRSYVQEETILQSGKNPLLTVTVSERLEVLEYSFDISNGVVNVKTVLKNGTDRLLNNVEYVHDEFSLTKNYQPGEEYTYEYVIEYDESLEYVDLGFPKVKDPNIKQICAAGAYTTGNPHNIFLFNQYGVYHDIGTEEYEDFCITQLGYTLNLGRIEVGEKPVEEVEEEKETEDEVTDVVEDVPEEDIPEVLGIDILPKTSKQTCLYIVLGIFLVALGILCYYLTNENTIRNA